MEYLQRYGSAQRGTNSIGSHESMQLVLRGQDPVRDQQLHRVRCSLQLQWQLFAFSRGEVLEHVVGRVHATGWATDAEPNPQVVLGAQGGRDRAQAVVAALPAAELDPDGRRWRSE